MLVGAGLPQLPGLAGEAKSYAERLFDFPTIGSLSPEDATAALVIPAQELAVEFEPNAVELIIESVAPRRSGLIAKGMIYSPAHGRHRPSPCRCSMSFSPGHSGRGSS